jgi:hypothetical protein
MPTIRAAVCHAFGEPLILEEVDLRAPEGREVEVTLEAVAICHSDISYADGIWGGTLPAVYGHEAAGRVTALGPEARGVDGRAGRRHADPRLRALRALRHGPPGRLRHARQRWRRRSAAGRARSGRR